MPLKPLEPGVPHIEELTESTADYRQVIGCLMELISESHTWSKRAPFRVPQRSTFGSQCESRRIRGIDRVR